MDGQRDQIVHALKRKRDESFAELTFAVAMGYVIEVKRLLRRGADVNGVNYDKRSALHMAAFEGNTHIVELLLDHGADKDGLNRWGRTPLAEAVHANQPHVVQVTCSFVNLAYKQALLSFPPQTLHCALMRHTTNW